MPVQLIYSSEAAQKLDLQDFERMLAEFRIRNKARGITGVLVLVDGIFVQVLEAEEQQLDRLLRSLERDPRHRDMKIFYRHEVAERAFASWSMAYLSASAEEVAKWAKLDGATTIQNVIGTLENEPERIQGFVVNLLRAIAD